MNIVVTLCRIGVLSTHKIASRRSPICLTFVSLILSLIFHKTVRPICLKFLLMFSQGENKKEVIYLWEKD